MKYFIEVYCRLQFLKRMGVIGGPRISNETRQRLFINGVVWIDLPRCFFCTYPLKSDFHRQPPFFGYFDPSITVLSILRDCRRLKNGIILCRIFAKLFIYYYY